MEVQLSNERKQQYDGMLKNIQDIEANIGSFQYRMHKMLNMREDVDKGIKLWWDEVLTEMKLDPKADYMITPQGNISSVDRKAKTADVKTVNDLV